jgi:hypothetical protein
MDLGQKTPKDTKTKESVVKRPKDLRQKTPTRQKQMRLLTEGLMDLG